MNDIEIIEYKAFKSQSDKPTSLKGFCRLKIHTPWGKLSCNEMQVFSKGGKHWVNFPAKKVEEQAGIKYYSYSRFENMEESNKFSDAVIKALTDFVKSGSSQTSAEAPSAHHSSSNGPRNGIPKPDPISMSPNFTSPPVKDDLPF